MLIRLKIAAVLMLMSLNAGTASVLYVDVNSANPTPPYADWSTAATNIQDAVDVSTNGDLVLVTNGVYQSGGETVTGSALTNRVAITNPIVVESVNGPTVTTIEGYQVPGSVFGDSAVRCVYLADRARLVGFTLVNGATGSNQALKNDLNGGGVWCQSTNSTVSNCVIVSNRCITAGAGAYSGTLLNCQVNYNTNNGVGSVGGGGVAFSVLQDSTIKGNYVNGGVDFGAGAFSCALSNCIIAGNFGSGVQNCTLAYCTIANNTNSSDSPNSGNGGGAAQSTLNNCLICNNQATNGGGAYECTLNFCTVSNNQAAVFGGGVYDDAGGNAPGASNYLTGNSARYGGGLYLGRHDVLSNWTFVGNSATRDGGGLYSFVGQPGLNDCKFSGNSAGGNGGGVCGDAPGSLNSVAATNCTFNGNSAAGAGGGVYIGLLQNCSVSGNKAGGSGGGVYGTVNNCILTGNVSTNNGGGVYFYPQQSGTFSNDVFTLNVASNGGGAYIGGNVLSYCVFLSNSVTVSGGGIYGGTAANCSFTNNQATYGGGGNSAYFINCRITGNTATTDGGGVYNALSSASVTNCLIENNSATNNGGGVNGGPVGKCILSENSAGANGGGAYNSSIYYCIISNNVARTNGGGIFGLGASLVNSLVTGNSAAKGGGVYDSFCYNSTIVNNSATIAGGGAFLFNGGAASSSILYYNSAPSGPNYTNSSGMGYCCTTPLPSLGFSNITSDPAFVNFSAGNFRLQTNSPCIDAGSGVLGLGPTDLDGRPRLVGTRIDIGAYEFQGPGVGEFIAWLQGYGLPVDGSADFIDTDQDGMNNWQEWICGTDPTNPLSVLKMLAVSNNLSSVTVNWQSVSNRTYFLQSSSELGGQPAFSTIQSNIQGQTGTTTITDGSATNSGPYFYRVGVQQ
jgi:predicted outer membrane repeat protein